MRAFEQNIHNARFHTEESKYGHYVTTECWREWEGRVWHVTFDEAPGTSEPLIREVDAPGSDEPPYMTEAERLIVDSYDDIDEEPALADLGL